MIKTVYGNIFDSTAQVIVNPVNTVGVMGKGLALQFKRRYPRMYRAYRHFCNIGALTVGKLWLCPVSADRSVLCFPTKSAWWRPSRMKYIQLGLRKLADNCQRLGLTSIAFPELGAGCGGLNADQVNDQIKHYLGSLPIAVYIYVY